jgi:predicted transcriptional regulator
MEADMQNIEPLIFDLVEWIAKAPRSHADVMNTWRTSCPRLTVWEDAVDRGLVKRKSSAKGAVVVVTEQGKRYLNACRFLNGCCTS